MKAGFLKEHSGALVLAILLHVAIAALLVGGFFEFRSDRKPKPAATLAIQATVVDEGRIAAEMQRQEQQQLERERREVERADQLKQEQETERQRLEELQRQRQEAEEQERQRVDQRQREEVERKRQTELEAQRQAELEAKAQAERKRQAEEESKRRAAEERRKAEETRQRADREAQLQRQLAEEERRSAAVASGLLAQYVAQIQSRIQRAWIRPPTARAGLRCIVNVTQVPGGEVVAVRIGECNGDEIVRRSIEAAVYRASPLPEPSDPTLFERNLRLEFSPND